SRCRRRKVNGDLCARTHGLPGPGTRSRHRAEKRYRIAMRKFGADTAKLSGSLEHMRHRQPSIHARSPAKIVGPDPTIRQIVSSSNFCVRPKTSPLAGEMKI